MPKLLPGNGSFDRFVPQLHLGYLRDHAGRLRCFHLNAFDNYRGESLRELGLKPGTPVRFEADASGRITRLQLTVAAKARAAAAY